MAFEDFTGASGFTSDSEGANANLDITMSEESARNLWDVQAAIQQIATDLQTAVRAASDFQSYLLAMRETAQTLRMPSLGMEGGEGGNMSYSGGRVDTQSVPLIQSELGMAQRVGEMEENASGAGGGAMAASGGGRRPFDPGEAVGQMTNIAWMASMAGQRGVPQETVSAYEQEYQFATRNRMDPQVLAASFGGQVGTPRAYAASRLITQGLPAAQQFLAGGGAGGIASMLGRAGAVGAVAYGGYQLVNAGLESYAQSRALAISTGNSDHGVAWGLGSRLSQAGMALSPFVSQQEAAQIYSSAVDQGWASRGGGGFDQGDFSSAVNFMYNAAKDYNMSPEMAAQLLQTNSLQAGESVSALSEQLFTLKKTLDGTGISMAQATSTFTSFTNFLISAGATPGDAAVAAGGMLKSFAGNTVLGPTGAGVAAAQQGLSGPGVQNILGALTGHLGPAALAGANLEGSLRAYEGIIHSLAVEYSNQTGMSEEDRVAQFMIAYQNFTGQPIDFLKAQAIMKEAVTDPHFMTKGQEDFKRESTMGALQHQNTAQQIWHGMDRGLFDLAGGGYTSMQKDMGMINAHEYWNEEINNLLYSVGDQGNKLVLFGPDGKPVQVDGHDLAGSEIAAWIGNPENYNKFKDASSGYYIKDLRDNNMFNSQNIGLGGANAGVTSSGQSAANTVYITLSDEAKKLINTDRSQLNLDDGKSKPS